MEKNLKNCFQEARNVPSEHLSQEVWQSICQQNKRNTWKIFFEVFICKLYKWKYSLSHRQHKYRL